MTKEEIQGEINALKQILRNTDYQAIKHSEGEMSDEEFEPIREARHSYRVRINELEAMLDDEEST